MGTNRLYGLDALRGIAATVVVLGHLQHITHAPWTVTNYALSVDFFFMLSGYVMARTYESRLGDQIGAFRFLWLRFRRLWRTMAIGTLLGFGLYLVRDGWTLEALPALAAGLLFLPWSLKTPWLYPFNGPSWSIFDELLANFVHALVLVRMSERMLVVALLASFAVFAAYIFSSGIWPAGGWPHQFLPAIARTFVSYIIGILLFRRFRDRKVVTIGFPVLLGAFPLAVLATAWMPAWSHLLFIFAVAPILVLGGISCTLTEREIRWAAASGAISFPLYAVHYPILEILTSLVSPVQALLITLAAIAGITWLLTRRYAARADPSPARIGA